MQEKTYNNILVHMVANLGDVIFSTSAVGLLKKRYPNAKITFLVRADIAELFQKHDFIDEVIPYEYKSGGDISSVWKLAKFLKAKQFDISISLEGRTRIAIATWLANIPVRVGPKKIFKDNERIMTWFYTDVIELKYSLKSKAQVENYQQIIRTFTGMEGMEYPKLGKSSDKSLMVAREFLNKIPDNKRKIVLCVKAVHSPKNWEQNRFAQVIKNIAYEYDSYPIIIGMREDFNYAEEIVKLSSCSALNLCGKTKLTDVVAIFRCCDAMISIDNGAAHLAAATNLPIVCIFTSTSPIIATPLAKISIPVSISRLKEYETKGDNEKVDISVEEVMGAFRNMMEKIDKFK